MFIQYLVRMIRTGWMVILSCGLLAVIVSLLVSLTTTPLYRSEVTFVISPSPDLPSSRDVVSSMAALDTLKIFSTYGEILTSDRVLAEALQAMDMQGVDLAQYSRRTLLLPDSIILRLTVEGPDPAVTALMANTIGQKGIDFIQAYFTVFDINFLDKALAPTDPFAPRPFPDGLLAAGIGLAGGLLIAVSRDLVRTPLRDFWRRTLVDRQSSAFSRRYFNRLVEREFIQNNTPIISLAIIELEGLRDILDVVPGFMLSDILHQVTNTLHNQLRGNDSIGRWDKVSFALLLPNTPGEPAGRTLTRLFQVLSEKITFGPGREEEILLHPAFGVSTRSKGETQQEILHQAQAALELMKNTSYAPPIDEA